MTSLNESGDFNGRPIKSLPGSSVSKNKYISFIDFKGSILPIRQYPCISLTIHGLRSQCCSSQEDFSSL
ncbi:hypothetical protein L6164_028073 [Bauhinia variegata]|uniref:Uncharacterized protein n=1 Tax=Bauhinia variegata TaxID=167791 RepID=A0ACB9LVW9_BAUVA|nr:hypothetical protein L6164_028073 [Bauhinia variegata]